VCTMVPVLALSTPLSQLLPDQPIPDQCVPDDPRQAARIEYVGRLRVPLAGPYRPWARLYRLPDGRTLWVLRLWDRTTAVRRVTTTEVLLRFAKLNGLTGLGARVRALERRARSGR